MAAPSLQFGSGNWELAGWYMPLGFPPVGAGLIASGERDWSGSSSALQQNEDCTLVLASGGGSSVSAPPLTPGAWHWLRAQRVSGTLRLFVNEVLAGTAASAQAWAFGLIGRNGWGWPTQVIDGVMTGWSAKTTGISTAAGKVPAAPAPVAQWYPNNLRPALLDAAFSGGQVRFTADGLAFADSLDWARAQPVRHFAAQMARDAEFGGSGTLTGTTMLAGQPDAPTRARVSILRMRDKKLARQVWSDAATGAWRVNGLDTERTRYVALAEWPSNPDDPATEGYLRPVTGVSPIASPSPSGAGQGGGAP